MNEEMVVELLEPRFITSLDAFVGSDALPRPNRVTLVDKINLEILQWNYLEFLVHNCALRLGKRPFQMQRSSIAMPIGTSAAIARSTTSCGIPSAGQCSATYLRLASIRDVKSARRRAIGIGARRRAIAGHPRDL